ncbi:EF-hand domain-containing protein [Amycolatopsis sp. NPDC088138]|uniref:EF-hand domain-containing protein n=1 Tax=Amycolatopsis sp. NPDC088138 TaxID=3363938 RepID=UPI0037FA0B1E
MFRCLAFAVNFEEGCSMATAPSIDPTVVQKIDLCFAHADTNNDGVVDGSDILSFAARIIVALGEPFGSPKAINLLQVADGWWKGLAALMDTDQNGVIDQAEYRAHMLKLVEAGAGMEETIRPLAVAIGQLCDRDDDGVISADEFGHFQRAVGSAPESAQVAFDKLDTNGDGFLDVDELVAAFRDFYSGTDPELIGNWLYGGTAK